MSTLLLVFLVGILVLIFCFVRVEIVCEVRRAELNAIRRTADELASEGLDWREAYAGYDSGPTFNEQLFMITKWTHAQFYPRGAAK